MNKVFNFENMKITISEDGKRADINGHGYVNKIRHDNNKRPFIVKFCPSQGRFERLFLVR